MPQHAVCHSGPRRGHQRPQRKVRSLSCFQTRAFVLQCLHAYLCFCQVRISPRTWSLSDLAICNWQFHHLCSNHDSDFTGFPVCRMYVAGKDMQQRVVYVALGQDHPALFASSAALQEAHWIAGQPPQALQESKRLECTFKARWGPAIA